VPVSARWPSTAAVRDDLGVVRSAAGTRGRTGGGYLWCSCMLAWATVAAIGGPTGRLLSPRSLYRPCRARPADRSLVAEDRSAEGVRGRTGPEPAGTRWVHADPAGRGVQRARAVTSGSEEPQVKPPTQPRPGRASGGGPEFESPHPAAASPAGSCPRGGGHRGRASPSGRGRANGATV
jgi:hypothetical protein